MHFFIQKLKISNFLSFFGDVEVNLKPFTTISCNYHEGKADFFQCLEFVFGAKLNDLKIDNPLNLVHKVLREEFLISHDIQSYVEITVNLVQEKKELKFYRGIKNGSLLPNIEHKISGILTSSFLYGEKLNTLGLNTNTKTLLFYKSYFNNLIWGSSEDLETTISICLREPCLLDPWKKAQAEVKHLSKLKRRTAEKNYNSIKKAYSVIEKYTKTFEAVLSNRKDIWKTTRQESSSGESSFSLLDFTEKSPETTDAEIKEKWNRIYDLTIKNEYLAKKLVDLRSTEAVLTSRLYHEEIKLAAKPVNASILQNRISEVKTKIRQKEKDLSEIWVKTLEVKYQVENLSEKITSELTSLSEIQVNIFNQNRFTTFGRFNDYFQPSRFLQLLKQILGLEIYEAHLCDTIEDAICALNIFKAFQHKHREVFLTFSSFSHKFKDLIIASDENGIQINTLEELLIFLHKLRMFGLLDEVPVIAINKFNFEDNIPKDCIVYPESGLQFTSDGLMSYKFYEDSFPMETEAHVQKNLIQLQTQEEIKYQEWKDLLFLRWETLVEINSLENDVSYLKQKWKKSSQKPSRVESEHPRITEIYTEYSEIFTRYAEEREKYEKELQQYEETSFIEGDSSNFIYSTNSCDDSSGSIKSELEEVVVAKGETKAQLKNTTKELRVFCVGPFESFKLSHNIPRRETAFDNRALVFEREFKKLKKLMTDDDLDDFAGSQEWRKLIILSLIRDFNEIKKKHKSCSEDLKTIATERKRILYPFIEHSNRYLSSTFNHLVHDALPFVDLNLSSGDEMLQLMSCMGDDRINVVDIKHFNTFLRFLTAFSVFLELAVYKQIPLMVIDDIEEYFPQCDEDLEAVINLNTLEKIIPDNQNPAFQLLMRIGQYLIHYIKKNTPRNNVRNNGSRQGYTSGPMQILSFAKKDFIHAGDHFIWIHSQTLPAEYITEDCNSYSKIHEINLNV